MSHKIRSYILEPEKSSNHSRKFPWPTANHTNRPLSRKSSSLKSSVYDSRGVPEHIHTHNFHTQPEYNNSKNSRKTTAAFCFWQANKTSRGGAGVRGPSTGRLEWVGPGHKQGPATRPCSANGRWLSWRRPRRRTLNLFDQKSSLVCVFFVRCYCRVMQWVLYSGMSGRLAVFWSDFDDFWKSKWLAYEIYILVNLLFHFQVLNYFFRILKIYYNNH